MKYTALVLALGLSSGWAAAQMSPQDHAAHHREGSGSAPAAVTESASKPRPAAADQFEQQMQMMQDMHRRMQAATTPAERQALMSEHMKLMQAGAEMMSQMGRAGAGGMGMGDKGMQGMGGMMAMHGAMERRMAMMEQMMQMMVDREAAMPSR